MNNILKVENCSLCGACYNSCPQKAIRLVRNDVFYSYSIDASICNECGKCLSVCPVNNGPYHNSLLSAYAGWHLKSDVVKSSSSGGAFRAISDYVLALGGVVFSAAYSHDFRTVEIVSSDDISINCLQKSKYVESCVDDAFGRIKEILLSGRYVLFCGTPCQVQGLCHYLKKDYNNLYTCDFCCGGLPSHKIYNNYLDELERRYNSKVESVDFRPKTHGWRQYAVKISFENGRVYNRLGEEDPYLNTFIHGGNTIRNNCLSCIFSDNHASDITLADFWKYSEMTSLCNDNGISLILCNSQKGEKIIQAIQSTFNLINLDKNKASYNNRKTECDENRYSFHNMFVNECVNKGVFYANKKYFPLSLKKRAIKFVKRKIRIKK